MPAGLSDGDDDREPVLREVRSVRHARPVVLDRVHPGRARGGEDVDGRALVDLAGEPVRRPEVEGHRGAGVRRPRTPSPMSVNASVSDDAAETVSSASAPSVTRRVAAVARRRAAVVVRVAARGQEQHRRTIARISDLLHSSTSSITLVAFTVATACIPGSSPISSTASRVTNARIRCGPARISTVAASLSRLTSVTTPGNRLRTLPEVIARPLATARRAAGRPRRPATVR